jgi:basic membrane protein A
MQIPIIESFQCGFRQGAAWAGGQRRSPVETVSAFIGNTPSAFSDPAKGKQMAAGMLRRGADVIYHAAGGSGNGAIDAAEAEGKMAIGVDTDQSDIAPETVLTSMRKRLDVAVANSIADVRGNRFVGGQLEMNVANGGVDLVLPGKLPPAAVALIEQARSGIVSNAIAVCDG